MIDHTEEGGEEILFPWRFGKPTFSYRLNEENSESSFFMIRGDWSR